MKTKSYLLLFALALTLLSTGFLAGSAAASEDCFTDVTTHWAETFICWMKDNGLTSGYPDGTFKPDNAITRAEVSVFMQKLYDLAVAQDAANLNSAKAYSDTQDITNLAAAKAYTDSELQGGVTINSGSTVWQVNAGGPQTINYLFTFAEFRAPAAGDYNYIASISVPSTLYGTGMYLDGMRMCYDANVNGAFIDEVRLYQVDSGNGIITASYTDPTDRTDDLCRTYSIATPTLFHADDIVVVYLLVDFNFNTDLVRVRSLNINLHPSPTGETVQKLPGGEVTPLVPFTEEP